MKKKFVISLLLSALLLFGGIVWAGGQYKTIKVYFERINMNINGQSVTLTKDSMIYNGSVYIPLKNFSDMLGAEASWDNENRAVHLDFLNGDAAPLYTASQKAVYQYIAFENNKIMQDLEKYLKNTDLKGMQKIVFRYEALREITKNVQDTEASILFEKLKAAAEMLRSGWASKTFDDYALAWTIYYVNADKLNELMKKRISNTSFEFKVVQK